MVLLHMKTDNALNTTLAKFDSIYDNAFIQFSNINNNIYLSGIANNTFKIYNPSLINDDGLSYNNNQLSVKSHNTQIIKNNNFTVFPNDFTPINSYEFTEPNMANPFGFINCFDLNSTTYWESEVIYSRNDLGTISSSGTNNIYSFYNTGSKGYWIKIKFPYQIIPIGVYFSSLTTIYSPTFFDIYVSNDNINWNNLIKVTAATFGNEIFFRDNTNLYLYFAIVITKMIPDANGSILQAFKITDIKIYSMPILHIDNSVKIANNNLFNITNNNNLNNLKNCMNNWNLNIISINDIIMNDMSNFI